MDTYAGHSQRASLSERVDAVVARTGAGVSAAWDATTADLAGYPDEAARPAVILSQLTGGKFLRSRLAVAAYIGLGGEDDTVAGTLAVSVQLLHLGLCVHDDLIDGDARRHGRPNVSGMAVDRALSEGSGQARAVREGMAAALLAGDLAISNSQRQLLSAPVTPTARLSLLSEMLEALAVTIGGEWLDVRSEVAPPEEVPTDAIAALKTARYTTVLPLRLGVFALGEGHDAPLAALSRFGQSLGVAYQMKDDELGVFGDPETTGKSVTADLRSGKRTGLLRLAYGVSTAEQRATLDDLIGRPSLSPEDAERLRGVIARSGARDIHAERMSALVATAISELSADQAIPAELSAYLTGAARLVVPRES